MISNMQEFVDAISDCAYGYDYKTVEYTVDGDKHLLRFVGEDEEDVLEAEISEARSDPDGNALLRVVHDCGNVVYVSAVPAAVFAILQSP